MEKAKYQVSINSYLILLETNPLDNNTTGGLGIVAIIVCVIIIFTSVFCIKNSFDISITEKIRQYGMLKSIGATKKQIKKNVLFEAFILGLIGIPLGILCGLLASYILIIVSNVFLKEMLEYGISLKFEFSWTAVAFSIVLGIITIYLSAIRSSKKASKISPIESIRNSGNIKIKSKKIKSPKIINKIFGIGGEISYKNLKRNKKKYRTTVISIVVSVATFIAMSSFVSLAFLEVKNELNMQDYNVMLSTYINNEESYKKIVETTKVENIEEYTILRQETLDVSNAKYSDEYKKEMNYNEDGEDAIDEYDRYVYICSVGENSYEKFIKELGLNYDNVKDKAILMDMQAVGIYNNNTQKFTYKNIKKFTYKSGDKVVGELGEVGGNEQDFEIQIASVTDKAPFGLSSYGYVMLIVSDEFFDSHFSNQKGDWVMVFYDSTDSDKLQDEIEEVLKGEDFHINNSDENARILNNLFTLVAIFLYGFIIVISLIGITNIFNTITTNMELRKCEFAMLKSVGMTKVEFDRMIRLESIFMGVKSLLFGVPIGLTLSYLIYHFLAENSGIRYPVPIKAIVICVVVVFIVIACIMRYSMNKIGKQNTIETIRNENI